MTEGHPCFVANNGRLGLGAERLPRATPRRPARPVRLVWLAVRRELSVFAAVSELDLRGAAP